MKDNNLLLKTERLYLRPIAKKDFEDVCLLDTDPEVRSYFPEGALNIEQVERELERYLREWQAIGFGIFAIFERETNQFIGRGGFAKLKSGEVEFGYLFLKEYWGKGYATEAAKALLEWGLAHIPVEYIIGFAPTHHIASIRVLEKCGMKYYKSDSYRNIPCVFYQIKSDKNKT